jgi:hypothetical protein
MCTSQDISMQINSVFIIRLVRANILMATVVFAGCVGTDLVDNASVDTAVSWSISPAIAALEVDQELQLVASGASLEDFKWIWSVSNSQVASIDQRGFLTGQKAGQTTVEFSIGEEAVAESLISVVTNPSGAALVELSPLIATLFVNETQAFESLVLDLNNNILTDTQVTYESSDLSVVSIDNQGLATAKGAGKASIKALSEGIRSLEAELRVLEQTRSGTFVGVTGHQVTGEATLSTQDSGALVLNFSEDFLSQGGPQLEVFLSKTSQYQSDAVALGALKSTQGAQSYEVNKAGVDLANHDWVLVHCVPYTVTFGVLELN